MTDPEPLVLRVDDEITLRLLVETDAEAIFALTEAHRAYLRRWLPWVDDTRTLEDTQRFIRIGLRHWAHRGSVNLVIWYRGAVVGVIGLNYINWERRITEIGYWLAESAQGQGVMTRACRALVTYAFKELGMERVEIRCAVTNDRSRAIPQRLGFIEDNQLTRYEWRYDHAVDAVSYRMLAADWLKGES